MRPRTAFIAVALSLLPIVAWPSHGLADEPRPAAATPSWEKVREDEGITVFRQEVPDSPIIAFKGIGVVSAPLARVISVVTDTPRTVEWMDSAAHARIVRKVSPLEQIIYTHIKSPPLISDRDFVTDAKGHFDATNKRFIVNIHSIVDAGAPPTSHVRGEILHSSFVLTSIDGGRKTLVVTEIHADPKGSVPKWVVNLFQKNWPYNTIKNLRTQAAKPDIRESPELLALMAKEGL